MVCVAILFFFSSLRQLLTWVYFQGNLGKEKRKESGLVNRESENSSSLPLCSITSVRSSSFLQCPLLQSAKPERENGEDENRRGSINHEETACCYTHSH